MDYSASIHEADDPTGPSPWGSSPTSSPQHHRTVFGPVADDSPPFAFSPARPLADADADVFGPSSQPRSDAEHQGAAAASSPKTAGPDAPTESSQPPSQPHAEPSAQQKPPPQKQPQPQFRLQAKITGLERTGKKDPVLRFDVHYRDVRRLHSEFVKLADHLISANPDAFVPAVPPPVTAAGAGTDEDETRVKALMQRWFNYVCSNEVLMLDDEMVLFVESDFGYSPMVKMRQPATGVRRKILKQFAPPPDDTPELADARPTVKLFYLGTMDAGHKVDKLVKSRRGLGLAESDFGVKLGSMNVQEPHPGLSNAYKKLGKVIQTVGDLHAAQATAEATTMGDALQYHSQDAFIVKESLTNRQILIREYLQAQEAKRSREHAADRLRASSSVRREKVDEAIAALEEARQTEEILADKTAKVTRNLVQERRKWFVRTATDLRLNVRELVLRQIEAERRTLALLETVRPDIRCIDASGGLSRLGRETHPSSSSAAAGAGGPRRSTVASSQGPKGDAWSGVPRRSDATARSVSGSFMARVPDDADEDADAEARPDGGAVIGTNEDDEDRIDARNAASRLATSTF